MNQIIFLDTTGEDLLKHLLLDFIDNSCVFSDGIIYTSNLADILVANGSILIEYNSETTARDFDNYENIFLLAESFDFLHQINNYAIDFNKPKTLLLSDIFAYSYNDIMVDTYRTRINTIDIPSYTEIYSWSSSHVYDYYDISKTIFLGHLINPLILSSLYVLDYLSKIYIMNPCNPIEYLNYILANWAITYTTKNLLYNYGDRINVDYILCRFFMNRTMLFGWDSHLVDKDIRTSFILGLDSYVAKRLPEN